MNRETTNFVAFVGLLVIVAIMMAPVDQGRVAADLNKMGPRVASHFADCPKVNFNISQSGGVVPYYRQRVESNREWQKTYYANNNRSDYEPRRRH